MVGTTMDIDLTDCYISFSYAKFQAHILSLYITSFVDRFPTEIKILKGQFELYLERQVVVKFV